MENVHLCTFFIDEICDERKSRFYMEPAASVPLFVCEGEQLRALRKPPVATKPDRQNVS